MLRILFDLANDLGSETGEKRPTGRKRAVFVLGGDVHMGGAHVIRSAEDGTGGRRDNRSNAAIYALTSSPISHPPEPDRLYRAAIEHASDDIDGDVIFAAKVFFLDVSEDDLLDVLGRKPASFVLDTERERLFRADVSASPRRATTVCSPVRRLDAPGRQYEFSFLIGGRAVVRRQVSVHYESGCTNGRPGADVTPGSSPEPNPVTFGGVAVGSQALRTVVLRNVSGDNASVLIAAFGPSALFRWPAFSGILAHGQQHVVEIVFRPGDTRRW